MKYFFPIHLDGGNRGCEGIAKGSAILLNQGKDSLVSLCRDVRLDKRLGTDSFTTLIKSDEQSDKIIARAFRKLCRIFKIPISQKNPYTSFVSTMDTQDVLISTGGDMMCYNNNQVITTNNLANKLGHKTILWGCSMGPENLTPEKEETLRKFSLIYTRDSLTYNFLKNLGLKNIVCYPDPAFILEPEKVELPSLFKHKKVIGINISNFTIGNEKSLDTPFGKEVIDLISYILNITNYDILLIPHVFWKKQDDRILSNLIKNHFKTSRIEILDSNKLNYLQIRYVISKCELFIGARTHAMISAYSCNVPSLALGYSIKSRGIAADLGLPNELVVNTKEFKPGELIKAFQFLDEQKDIIRNHLEKIIPNYRKNTFNIRKDLQNIIYN